MKPIVLAIVTLLGAAGCFAQARQYDIRRNGNTAGTETITVDTQAKLVAATDLKNPDGRTARTELSEDFYPDGSNKRAYFSLLLDDKQGSFELTWREGNLLKVVFDINGEKETFAKDNEMRSVTGSTAVGMDLSITSWQVALRRALKSGMPAKIALITLPTGAQAGQVTAMRVAKSGSPISITLAEKPTRVQEYAFREIDDSEQNPGPPILVWANANTGEIIAVRLPEEMTIVQHGLDPATLPNWNTAKNLPAH
jgi:hypothetical protein